MGNEQTSDTGGVQFTEHRSIAGGLPVSGLLTSSTYFARYGEHLGDVDTPYAAWLRVEADFSVLYSTPTHTARRFMSYAAFCNALRLWRNGKAVKYVKIYLIEK